MEQDLESSSLRNSLLLHGSNGLHHPSETGGSCAGATFMLVFTTSIAVCGSYVFGAALGYSSPAENGIREDLGLSLAEYSVFGSIMSIGAMFGAIISGKIADLVGRRGAMGISQIICTIGWLAITFSKGALVLDIGRLLTGFGVGLISYVVPVYIAEITPKNLRGGFSAAHQLVLSVGTALTYFIGAVVSWRILAVIGIIPAVTQLIGLLIIPESPRWLAKNGRLRQSETALKRLRGENADISEEAIEIHEYIDTLAKLPEGKILDLFQKIYARSLIVGIIIMLLQQLAGTNAVNFYANSIFELAGFSADIGSVVMAVVKIPMALISVLLMDKIGRKPLLTISTVGAALGCFLTALSFAFQYQKEWKEHITPVLVFVGVTIYNASSGLGLAGIPWVIMSEIFPINMKGSAGSLVSLINWFSSWIVAYVFNFLMQWSSAGTFLIFFIISCLTVLFIAICVPETKGRTLEEIQAMMNPSTDTK